MAGGASRLCGMILGQLIAALEEIAPTSLAEPWDNVGLLLGDPAQKISGIMLTIDYTRAVAAEAAGRHCDLIVAYHPPIFTALKRLPSDSLIVDAIRRGAAIYSPHTALDVVDGGTNDALADALGLVDRQPLRPPSAKPAHYKLVTFLPQAALERVSRALFDAGAGIIGEYSSCSFQTAGTGTFFGQAGTNPAVGQSGKLQRVDEIRFETLVPIAKIDQVVQALRQSHPYEEPAFDLNMLAPTPARAAQPMGMGRIGALPPTSLPAIVDRLKGELGLSHLLIAGPTDRIIIRAAVCAGSCGDLLDDAIAGRAQLYVTGEMRHHDAIKAAEAGMTVVCTLHSNSERAMLGRLKTRLDAIAGMPPVLLSASDRDPFTVG
jgi:dinuclear metal center YbgI/SA1388 family protein